MNDKLTYANRRLRYTDGRFIRSQLFADMHILVHRMNMAFDMYGKESHQYKRIEYVFNQRKYAYNFPQFA